MTESSRSSETARPSQAAASRRRLKSVVKRIRTAWLNELRGDVVNATLVAILQNKGAGPDPATAEAGLRGCWSIQQAAQAVKVLHD
jgi:hypothetical protein